MKNTFTFLIALLMINFTFGQEEEKEQDTTRISYKGKVIIITNESGEDTKISLKDVEKEEDEKDKKWNVNLWRGIEFGVNGYFTDDNFGINKDANNVYLELDYGKSFMFNLNLFEINQRLGTENFRFFTGLGFRFNRYAFKSTNNTLSYNDTSVYNALDSSKTFDKNFLNASYISAPVFFTFMPGKDPNKSFHISVGAILNYRIGSRVKQKYVTQDQKRKDIEKGHYHLNPFQVDGSVRIGRGDFSVYANYGLNGLFEPNKGPDYTPFSMGLSWTF